VIVLDPWPDRENNENIGETRDHRLSAGTQLARLDCHETHGVMNPPDMRRASCVDIDYPRQHRRNPSRREMVEADHRGHRNIYRKAPLIHVCNLAKLNPDVILPIYRVQVLADRVYLAVQVLLVQSCTQATIAAC
jgi:hypothetical protein